MGIATGGSPSSGGRPSTILRRGGHPSQHMTALVEIGPEESYQKQGPCISMHPVDGRVRPGEDTVEGVGWL